MRLFRRLSASRKYKRAIVLFNRGLYARAADLLEAVMQESASGNRLHYHLAAYYCAQAHFCRGMIFFAMENYADAVTAFESARKIQPERVEIFEYLGICYNNIGKYHETLDALGRVVALAPNHYPTRLRLAVAFHNLSLWDRAREAYRDLIGTYGNYADAHFYLGLTCLEMGEPEQALDAFSAAVSINPGYRSARVKLAVTRAHLGQRDQAAADLAELCALYPEDPELHYLLGRVLMATEDMERVAECFKQALSRAPDHSRARTMLSSVRWRQGRFDEARAVLREGLERCPDDSAMTHLLRHYDVLMVNGTDQPEVSGASDLREDEMLSAATGTKSGHLSMMPNYSEMLSVTSQMGNENPLLFYDLVDIVKQSEPQYEGSPEYHCSLGYLYHKIHRFDEAVASFNRAIEKNPQHIQAHLLLFRTRKAMDNLPAAVQAGRFLVEKKVPYADFYFELGEVFEKLGEVDRAREVLESALSLNPKYVSARMLLQRISLSGEAAPE